MLQIDNCIIYLALKPNDLIEKLSIQQWNDFIVSYSKDKDSIVEEYDKDMDGYVFITTNLYNILTNHSIMDLRFNLGYRSAFHKSEYKLK